MKKKSRIRYSELAPGAAGPTVPPVDAAPTPPAARRPAAPVDLARALAAARVAERATAAAIPGAPSPQDAPGHPATAVSQPPVSAPASVSASATRSLRERVRARSGHEEILLFRIATERFAIALAAVEEAIDIPPVHHVPEMPSAMLGVITVRGSLTAVYSPGAALGLSLHDGTSALIFRRGRSRFAVVVDEVDDVTSLDLSLLRDAPGLDAGDGIVLGVVRQRDSLLALVDGDALLSACQAVPLLETA
ncbi:MAG TPA: chemotaxis protein CheW [Gemmatimonadaceae bacterium]|nr:chemotaxis protein CheW [Gemmatimonadaceae bacterium]